MEPRNVGPPELPPEPLAPPPRAFAQGTGVVLQTVGVLLFLSNCCVCSLTGIWDPVQSRSETYEILHSGKTVGVTFRSLFETPARAGYMATVMFGTVGGLGLAVLGLGLQSEHRRAAAGAFAAAAALSAIMLAAAVGLWFGGGSVGAKLWNLALLALVLTATGFAYVAWQQ